MFLVHVIAYTVTNNLLVDVRTSPSRRELICLSHARTVVRECCKGDDESRWERGKFDLPLPPQKTLNRWSPKFVWITASVISTTMQNFIQIG